MGKPEDLFSFGIDSRGQELPAAADIRAMAAADADAAEKTLCFIVKYLKRIRISVHSVQERPDGGFEIRGKVIAVGCQGSVKPPFMVGITYYPDSSGSKGVVRLV